MGKRKKVQILPPSTRSDVNIHVADYTGTNINFQFDDLIEGVGYLVDLLYPLQYVDTDLYDLLCRKMAHDQHVDYYRELKWWLTGLKTFKWKLEVAQYLATLTPEIPELTIDDIDDDTLYELMKFANHDFHHLDLLDEIIELCNNYYK